MSNERYLFRGRRTDNDERVTGYYIKGRAEGLMRDAHIATISDMPHAELEFIPVGPATIEPVRVKPITHKRGDEFDDEIDSDLYCCPNCTVLHGVKYNFCPDCGQALDWSET